MPSFIARGGLLLPSSQVASYPGEAVQRPPKPVAAFAVEGDGWAGLAMHDPESTTLVPFDGGMLVAQLIFSEGPDAAIAALPGALPDDGWKDLGFRYETTDDESVLIHPMVSGSAIDSEDELAMMEGMGIVPIRAALPAGRYGVGFRMVAPDPATSWLVVRLTRVAG